jgi:hypothetical protein
MNLKLTIAFLVTSSSALAQVQPTVTVPQMTPVLISPSQGAVDAVVQGNQVIASIMAARGSDPTKWNIAPAAARSYEIPAMRAELTTTERLDRLRVHYDRLVDQMNAYGYRFNADGLACVLAPGACVLDENRAQEIHDLAIELANIRREIDELEHSWDIASSRYIAAMKALGVPPPSGALARQPQMGAQQQNMYPRREPSIRASAPEVQADTLKDCSPVWETHTSWVLTPKMVGFNHSGEAQLVYQYQPVHDTRATYPAGCK